MFHVLLSPLQVILYILSQPPSFGGVVQCCEACQKNQEGILPCLQELYDPNRAFCAIGLIKLLINDASRERQLWKQQFSRRKYWGRSANISLTHKCCCHFTCLSFLPPQGLRVYIQLHSVCFCKVTENPPNYGTSLIFILY